MPAKNKRETELPLTPTTGLQVKKEGLDLIARFPGLNPTFFADFLMGLALIT